jgi:hypothetical protein
MRQGRRRRGCCCPASTSTKGLALPWPAQPQSHVRTHLQLSLHNHSAALAQGPVDRVHSDAHTHGVALPHFEQASLIAQQLQHRPAGSDGIQRALQLLLRPPDDGGALAHQHELLLPLQGRQVAAATGRRGCCCRCEAARRCCCRHGAEAAGAAGCRRMAALQQLLLLLLLCLLLLLRLLLQPWPLSCCAGVCQRQHEPHARVFDVTSSRGTAWRPARAAGSSCRCCCRAVHAAAARPVAQLAVTAVHTAGRCRGVLPAHQ